MPSAAAAVAAAVVAAGCNPGRLADGAGRPPRLAWLGTEGASSGRAAAAAIAAADAIDAATPAADAAVELACTRGRRSA